MSELGPPYVDTEHGKVRLIMPCGDGRYVAFHMSPEQARDLATQLETHAARPPAAVAHTTQNC